MTTPKNEVGAILPCPFCQESKVRMYPPTCNRWTPYNPADRAFPVVRCVCGAEKCGDDWDQSGRTAIAAWNRRASHEPKGWISVADRLPGEHQTVAVVLDSGAIVTAWATYWHGASNAFNDWVFPHPDDDGCVVTHWHALPAAPSLPGEGQ